MHYFPSAFALAMAGPQDGENKDTYKLIVSTTLSIVLITTGIIFTIYLLKKLYNVRALNK